MGTTLGFSGCPVLVGVVAEPPAEPVVDRGESTSLPEGLLEPCALVGAWATEFLRLAAFLDLEVPTGAVLPLPRLRFLITSVFRLSGRTTPWSFKKSPQALHRGLPSGLRRHNGVVWVKQFVQVVGAPLLSSGFGLPGLEVATEENPDSCGEFGEDCVRMENMPVAMPAVLGVDVVRGTFLVLGSPPRFLISLTEAADPCPRLRPP